eukprot:TRINITY_DN2246_c0_g1_i1.p1 TRINITY_DN2246_c0_g1~~TRINITY_DN2246_c0_g1_i1.p1  ORF type:complete len:290 (+),score=45.36 TRINITY_DN2246_c0_g1_i1:78-947(+)
MVLGAGRSPPPSPKVSPNLTPRTAFMLGDPALSKALHQNKVVEPGHDDRYGRALKNSFIMSGFGGLLFSHVLIASLPQTFAEVAATTAGLAVSCGFALGVLSFLSKRSYKMQYHHERSRELWEMENFPDGERQEMVELFEAQGLSTADSKSAIATMSKEEYKNFFIDLMMMQEIGMQDPDLEPSALQTATIVSATFSLLALWPIFVGALARWMGFLPEPVTTVQLGQLLFLSSTAVMVAAHFVMDGVLLPEQRFGPLYLSLGATSVCCVFVSSFVREVGASCMSVAISA